MNEMNLWLILAAGVAAFIIVVLFAKPVIKKLTKLKFGQEILEIGPSWHASKRGTPTMGGFLFIFAIVVTMLVFIIADIDGFVSVLLCALAFGAIGFVDDYTKVVKKRNLGLTALQKSMLQTLVAFTFVLSMYLTNNISLSLDIPFTALSFSLPLWLYFIFSVVVIVGFTNAVNLTDGLDGLATSVMIPVAIFFTISFFILGNAPYAALSSALTGALLGFLIYNFNPAKVFMGDTGSLFLGGMLCALCYALKMPLIIIIVGFLFLIEAVSVMLQVAYFKLTKGKRLFKMAPIHHHFEKCGYNEKTIVLTATLLSVLLCAVGFYAVFTRLL